VLPELLFWISLGLTCSRKHSEKYKAMLLIFLCDTVPANEVIYVSISPFSLHSVQYISMFKSEAITATNLFNMHSLRIVSINRVTMISAVVALYTFEVARINQQWADIKSQA
jgi:hypothetical protein